MKGKTLAHLDKEDQEKALEMIEVAKQSKLLQERLKRTYQRLNDLKQDFWPQAYKKYNLDPGGDYQLSEDHLSIEEEPPSLLGKLADLFAERIK